MDLGPAVMKTLKISLVATVAVTLAWWFHLPQAIWPDHPMLADTLLALALCLVLQYTWTSPKSDTKSAASSESSVKE
jgi:hypothetical protein